MRRLSIMIVAMTPVTDLTSGGGDLLRSSRLLAVRSIVAFADDSGVLSALAEPASSAELAGTLGLDPVGLERLLTVLLELDLVGRDDGRWRLGVDADVWAVSREVWSHLDAQLHGAQRRNRSDRAPDAARWYPAVVHHLAAGYGTAPEQFAAAVAPNTGRILDVGAGSAVWSRAVARRLPSATAVALELPEVVPATRAAIAADGLDDRFEIVAADLWSADFDAEFDLVVVAGLCHLFAEERAQALVERAGSWLPPSGTLAVIDAGPLDRVPAGPARLDAAIHDLSLWVRSDGGRRPIAQVLRWLIAAGLSEVGTIDVGHALTCVRGTLAPGRPATTSIAGFHGQGVTP